jgi:thiamine pyrophosphate-dependent acetolactate synthase large subunit-like protein
MEHCDTLLMVGTSFPYIEFLPRPGQAKAVQIDLDPMRIGPRYPADVGLVGDAAATLRALLPLLHRKSNRRFLEQAQERMRVWSDQMEKQGTRGDQPMKPEVPVHYVPDFLVADGLVLLALAITDLVVGGGHEGRGSTGSPDFGAMCPSARRFWLRQPHW